MVLERNLLYRSLPAGKPHPAPFLRSLEMESGFVLERTRRQVERGILQPNASSPPEPSSHAPQTLVHDSPQRWHLSQLSSSLLVQSLASLSYVLAH